MVALLSETGMVSEVLTMTLPNETEFGSSVTALAVGPVPVRPTVRFATAPLFAIVSVPVALAVAALVGVGPVRAGAQPQTRPLATPAPTRLER